MSIQKPTQIALGSTGDIELGNRVTSINGMRIFTQGSTPSQVGNYHEGDTAVDSSNLVTKMWIYRSGAWVQVLPIQLYFATNAAITAGSTQYFALGLNNTEANVQLPVLTAVNFSSMLVHLSTAVAGATESITVTLRKNGIDTSITTTIASGIQSGSDTSHTASISGGGTGLFNFKVVSSAGAGTPFITVSLS